MLKFSIAILYKKAMCVRCFRLFSWVQFSGKLVPDMNRAKPGFWSQITVISLGILMPFLAFTDFDTAQAATGPINPRLANYYLNELNSTNVNELAKFNLLVLTPAQIQAHEHLIQQIKKINPQIIILAYVPSTSYNKIYWRNDITFRTLNVQDNWWLRSSSGKVIEVWPGLDGINLSPEWTEYFLSFVKNRIANNIYIDGIFFDMVGHSISAANGGDIDLNGDGVRDSAAMADALWLERTTYFFKRAKELMPNTYIVNNGTSVGPIQPFVNGRMYENFPTPWEANGNWGGIMNLINATEQNNQAPVITIINSNTANTGVQNYRNMRFGLGSALLENGYFSYDFGDQNHGQTWWYDEYAVSLGVALGPSASRNNFSTYKPDVWRRDFEHGLVVVNSLSEPTTVDLGGEYEKINGKQDPTVNDGAIVSELDLDARDGVILLKTTSKLNEIIFTNGNFARFYTPTGGRVRNGYFLFDETYKGGDQVLYTDINGDKVRDTVVASGSKITAWDSGGEQLFKIYPYTANYKGALRFAVGDVDGDGQTEVYTAPSTGAHPIKIYNLIGEEILPAWFPFGKKYAGGYSLAIANPTAGGRIVIGSGAGRAGTVGVYNAGLHRMFEWSVFDKKSLDGVSIGTGDLDGDGGDEIMVGFGNGQYPILKTYTVGGARFAPDITFKSQVFRKALIRSTDVDFDGKDDIVLLTEGTL